MDNQHIDSRMEAALKEDAAGVSALSSEVPASLRSLIASTPAATTAAVGVTAVSTAKLLSAKVALWSLGGLLVASAGYYALTSQDKTPISSQPEPTLTPILTAVDTPKPVIDTAPRRTSAAIKPTAKQKITYTQAQIDSMLRARPEPVNTLKDDGKIHGEIKKK
jgi:hypothetical protein